MLYFYAFSFTFFSLSAADPERIASSIASLTKEGFVGALAFGCAAELGLPWGKAGGGGGGAPIGGGGVKTREEQVKEERQGAESSLFSL